VARTKQKKLQQLNELPNVFNIKEAELKVKLKKYFKIEKPVTLEIGCGHGDYSVELAQKFPERNFVGIDVKGARIYIGATKAMEMNLKNVAFIVSKAEWLIEIFKPGSVEEIYIPFPEPHERRANQNRRLVSPAFLKIYKDLLIDSGKIKFKTDNKGLFEYALKNIEEVEAKIIYSTNDLQKNGNSIYDTGIVSRFEKHYLNKGRTIKYICFMF